MPFPGDLARRAVRSSRRRRPFPFGQFVKAVSTLWPRIVRQGEVWDELDEEGPADAKSSRGCKRVPDLHGALGDPAVGPDMFKYILPASAGSHYK